MAPIRENTMPPHLNFTPALGYHRHISTTRKPGLHEQGICTKHLYLYSTAFLLLSRKSVHRSTFINLARLKQRGGEAWLIWTIRKMLRFQAKCSSEIIALNPTHFIPGLHKITPVKLQSRFCSINRHHNTRLVPFHYCCFFP